MPTRRHRPMRSRRPSADPTEVAPPDEIPPPPVTEPHQHAAAMCRPPTMAAATAEPWAHALRRMPRRRPSLRFSKMHGAGNDFVVLDLRDGTPAADAGAEPRAGRSPYRRRLRPDPDHRTAAQRRRGRQLPHLERRRQRRAQCGNGARCVAAWLVRDGSAPWRALRARQPGRHPRGRTPGRRPFPDRDGRAAVRAAGDSAGRLRRCAGRIRARHRRRRAGRASARCRWATRTRWSKSTTSTRAPVATLGAALQAHARVPRFGQRRLRRGRCARPHPPARVRARRRRDPGLRQRRLRGGGDPDAARPHRPRGRGDAARRRIAHRLAVR